MSNLLTFPNANINPNTEEAKLSRNHAQRVVSSMVQQLLGYESEKHHSTSEAEWDMIDDGIAELRCDMSAMLSKALMYTEEQHDWYMIKVDRMVRQRRYELLLRSAGCLDGGINRLTTEDIPF